MSDEKHDKRDKGWKSEWREKKSDEDDDDDDDNDDEVGSRKISVKRALLKIALFSAPIDVSLDKRRGTKYIFNVLSSLHFDLKNSHATVRLAYN